MWIELTLPFSTATCYQKFNVKRFIFFFRFPPWVRQDLVYTGSQQPRIRQFPYLNLSFLQAVLKYPTTLNVRKNQRLILCILYIRMLFKKGATCRICLGIWKMSAWKSWKKWSKQWGRICRNLTNCSKIALKLKWNSIAKVKNKEIASCFNWWK